MVKVIEQSVSRRPVCAPAAQTGWVRLFGALLWRSALRRSALCFRRALGAWLRAPQVLRAPQLLRASHLHAHLRSR